MGKNKSDIHSFEMQWRALGADLEQEDDAPGFLGVTLEHKTVT